MEGIFAVHGERRRWEGHAVGSTRRDRLPCDESIYLPDALGGRRFVLDGDVAADVSDAEAALVRLDTTAYALADAEAPAKLLLGAECIASSRIEGLEVRGRRLLRADAARKLGKDPRDVAATEVLSNIDAIVWGVSAVVTVDTLLEIYRHLLAGTPLEKRSGRNREVQNWIGGSDYNPCSAEFVPPPPETVAGLLDDLFAFCNDGSLLTLAQSAIAHAQFETINPFVDGNGRTGRALFHLVMRRRGLGLRVLPPISLIPATWSRDYVGGPSRTRYVGSPDSTEAHTGFHYWIALFAAACRRAVDDASRFEERVRRLQEFWRERTGPIRRDSAARLLIGALPEAPVLTTATAAELIGRSFQAASQAVNQLIEAGVLKQVTVGRRNRASEASELIEAVTALERQLVSPGDDSRVSSPAQRRASTAGQTTYRVKILAGSGPQNLPSARLI